VKQIAFIFLSVSTAIVVGLNIHWGALVMALSLEQDIPEEILRMEVITAARSPIDGRLVSAAEYAKLQERLAVTPPPKLDIKIREQVFLLRVRKFLLQIFPFLDI
jgi:hypothetical protein